MTDVSSRFDWNPPAIRESWQWNPEQIEAWQLTKLNQQFAEILQTNAFYQAKLGTRELRLEKLSDLAELPMTTKQDLVESAAATPNHISRHHTYDEALYSRLHRTSGTTGEPLIILDTADDWARWSGTWQHVLEAADVTAEDRVFMAFSFGPFIGFWSAHQACIDRGATVIPGGGLSSLARLEFMRHSRATVMFCTPSYALHLIEVAEHQACSLRELGIGRIIVAGESGGSVPAVRWRIEQAWGAQVVDHSGATEIGPWGFGWPDRPGLHVIETSFVAETIPLVESSMEDPLRELVLTSLGRLGAPVIRYRTGDVMRAERPYSGDCRFLWLPNGVVGRADNMVTVRGVNVFPSSIEAIVRSLAGVAEYRIAEYRVTVKKHGQLDQLELEAETDAVTQAELEKRLTISLGLRIPVKLAEPGTLPRSEGKSQRWRDARNK